MKSLMKQISKIKDNWLILLLFLFLIIFLTNTGVVEDLSLTRSYGADFDEVYAEKAFAQGLMPSYDDFAPEESERKIIQSASITTEVDRGKFKSSENKLKNIVSSTNSFILNEDVNKYGTKRKEYFQGNYLIKVETTKYTSILSQLKEIGEVQDFNENFLDVTGQYTNTKINLEIEKSRLERYKELYEEAEDIEDKLTLNNYIFNQERTIKYLEDSLKTTDEKIEYSTIQFIMIEKRSEYMDVLFVKFSSLIKDIVDSFNLMLSLIFKIVPWIILIILIGFFWRFFRKR